MLIECVFSPAARRQLEQFRVYDQRKIVAGIRKYLIDSDPGEETRHKFALRPPSEHADYELRIGDFRVLYNIEAGDGVVRLIIAIIGTKVRDRLIVEGEELIL
jgi:mRNA-degrading endonuclease RelE of RelBE toxin-antitoxin system